MYKNLQRLLLIEDEPDIQEITKSALELVGGFEVETANNGFEGINKALSFLPDLILLDMLMPGKNGIAVFEELQKIEAVRHIPVIFMTAKVLPNELKTCITLGAIDVISKPFDPMQISNQILLIWDRYNV
jgi:two-component system OmpR family response regulator